MSDQFGADPLLVETIDRLLTDVCSATEIESAETSGWSSSVWDAIADVGFPWVSVPLEAGGSGGSLADAMAILYCVGGHAAPVPVAETGVLAGWLMASAGLALPAGPVTMVPEADALSFADGRLTGTATVVWAQQCERIVALVAHGPGYVVASTNPSQLEITSGQSLAGEPRDLVRFDLRLSDVDYAPTTASPVELRNRGALSRVVMSAGALNTIAQMTIAYTGDRQQFGKPVASFQAVQHHLVTVAQCAVRVNIAAQAATRAVARGDAGIHIASAKVITDQAITAGTRAAHQAHGAMGVTREYPLHRFTRRLWAWQHEYGSAATWRRELGQHAHSGGADNLFPLITR